MPCVQAFSFGLFKNKSGTGNTDGSRTQVTNSPLDLLRSIFDYAVQCLQSHAKGSYYFKILLLPNFFLHRFIKILFNYDLGGMGVRIS
jgi:hypothetical protein